MFSVKKNPGGDSRCPGHSWSYGLEAWIIKTSTEQMTGYHTHVRLKYVQMFMSKSERQNWALGRSGFMVDQILAKFDLKV